MNSKVFNTLEYNKIIELLESKASSGPGQNKCHKLTPSDDIDEIIRLQEETRDAFNRLIKNGNISFAGNMSIYGTIKSLDIGASVSASELLEIGKLLDNTSRVKSYGRHDSSIPEDRLDILFDALSPLAQIASEIRRCIISEDEISDDASPALKNIRRKMKQVNDRIHSQLTSMVSGSYSAYLQDHVITMRDGRYCIPVKAEYKNSVPGMVHDQSSTASTYFIEPAAIVNLNNELRELEISEVHEIEVILATISSNCAEHTEEIKCNIDTIAELDFIFARALLAIDQNAMCPIYNTDGIINIKKARHPLLNKKKCVPIDIRLGEEFDLLIITGPNTGGKTVALKTLGLLSLMGQSGLHVPAQDGCKLTVFKEVFADIGDEQSIEQSLSTFSAHMKNIVTIVSSATEDSLCLFDELGAGTDPTEGAALAIAILSSLHERGIRTVATTHYSELKVFAIKEPGVENACCEFNVDTLSPTYRLLIGIPGKSNAFAISSKLGLPNSIIDSAKDQLSKQDMEFEDMMVTLEENRVTIEREKLEIEKYRREIDSLKQTYESKQNHLNEMRDKIIEDAKAEAREILQDAKDTADESISYFHKHGSIQGMEKQRDKVRNKLNKVSPTSQLKPSEKKSAHKASDFKLGENVKIISMNLKGTVNSLPDSKGNLFVQCGIMRMQSNINDLELLGDENDNKFKGKNKSHTSGVYGLSKASSISTEINLLGRTVDDALSELDKYLDDAYLSHLSTVRVVHGKGTGALRNAVQQHLRKVKYVKSFHLAEYGEGDSGVTIVEFK